MHYIQPYTSSILEALIGLLVVFVLGAIRSLRVKAETWLQSHTTALQLATVHKLAAEAAAFVEATVTSGDGAAKLERALDYVVKRLNAAGIPVDVVSVRAAIEKAVQDFNTKGVDPNASKDSK